MKELTLLAFDSYTPLSCGMLDTRRCGLPRYSLLQHYSLFTYRAALDLMPFNHLLSLAQVEEKCQTFLVIRTL